MAELNALYKCLECGNIVSVIGAGKGDLVCCGKPMEKLEEKTSKEEGVEKHVPVLEIEGEKVKVKVGSVEHPMEKSHFIEMIQLLKEGKIIAQKQLSPGEKPEAEFCVKDTSGIRARELCNLHGLWTS